MPFVPTGYLTLPAAIDRVVELMQGVDGIPLLTEEQRGVLRDWQRWWRDQLSRPQPKPVTPVPKVGDRGLFVARTPSEKYPHRLVEAEPRRPDVTPEEIKDLLKKETSFKEQQHAAGEVLRQLLYAGRVPSEMITGEGPRIETPQYIWGGGQWDEALKSNWVEFPGAYGVSVSGRPIILLDALEAAFNPDGTVKEEPQPVASKSTAGAEDRNDERPELKQDEGRPPDKQPGSKGRPTFKTEIEATYKELRDAGDINFGAPQNRLYEPIRQKIRAYKNDPSLEKGLQEEAIRKVISPLFEADKNKRPGSP